MKEKAQHLCVDEFALRKGRSYATSVLDADTGCILAIVPQRDQTAMASAFVKETGKISNGGQ
ncbi:transposase [Bacillus xiapuensis]|uniref:transposase n=1 Tax=Bacillus xiapuensis TaxID=2014075 RepID=UPI000C23EF01|nr:transposase [Bacillus xiapuensis]